MRPLQPDQNVRTWLKRNNWTFNDVNRVCEHLFGLRLLEAERQLSDVYRSTWPKDDPEARTYGTTQQGLRKEIGRILRAEQQFDTVKHLFT